MKSLLTMLAVGLFCLSAAAEAQDITGAGSSFAGPLYNRWGQTARNQPSGTQGGIGVRLSYSPVGSGGGLTQIIARQTGFGASDAPVAPDRLRDKQLMQFPTAIGAVNVIVNSHGVTTNQMKMSGPVLADIYTGSITMWDDPRIKALNPGIALPSAIISPVFRSDSSGTTFVFTGYLALLSPVWKSHMGSGTAVRWPTGFGARGSDGVASAVAQTEGSIGYIESAIAEQNGLVTVQMMNAAGKFVLPGAASYTATALHADWAHAQDFAVDLNNQPGDDSWPIETVTFALVPTNPADVKSAFSVLRFFDYGFAHPEGAKELHYVPLPQSVEDAVRRAWKQEIHGPDGRPLF